MPDLALFDGAVSFHVTKALDFIFPDGLVSIGDHSFHGCYGLTGSLTFPKELTSIGSCAFRGCSNLIVVHAPAGSYAATWAVENGYTLAARGQTGLRQSASCMTFDAALDIRRVAGYNVLSPIREKSRKCWIF